MVSLHRNFMLLAGLLVLILVTGALAAENFDFLGRVDSAVASGEISVEEALLYKFHYGFNQDLLPEDFRPTGFQPLKNGTEIVWEYQQLRDSLSSETVAVIDEYLRPKVASKAFYVSPLGYFQLTYDTSGTNAVPTADTNTNGIPDFVEHCADYMDTSWDVEINTMGFTAPPINPYYQVSFEDMAYYGYTSVVSGTTTRIVLHNNFIGFPANDDPEGNQLGAAKVTCGHEFKHASQRAQSGWSEGGWVELDATWMEDVVFDTVNDFYNYLPSGSPISNPEQALDNGGSGSYEDCIWQTWMSETWGDQIIIDFWAHRATHTGEAVLTSYNTILGTYGSSIAQGFPTFAAWNYATGSHAISGFGYGEAADFPLAPSTGITAYPATRNGTLSNLSAGFLHCTGFSGLSGSFEVSFNGQDGVNMGLVAVVRLTNGTAVMEPIALDANNDAVATLSMPLETVASVGMAVSNATVASSATWSLTVNAQAVQPIPLAQLTATSLNKTLKVDSLGWDTVGLSNQGEAGSVLDYSITVVDTDPTPAMLATFAAASATSANAHKDPLSRDLTLTPEPGFDRFRYAGDCELGNWDTATVQGYYGDWWWGSESYAYFISPSAEACVCDVDMNIRAVHMLLYLEPTSTPSVQVHLMTSTGGSCPTPGVVVDSSPVAGVSGIPSAGYYDIEVACDFGCVDMGVDYFLVFEFLDANGPVGIPVDSTPQSCVNYNDWGSGYSDLVSGYGFAGDLFIWADLDCCGTAVPAVSVLAPNGGEIYSVGQSVNLTWNATVITDVKVELSRDGGGAWETLFASTVNDGSEAWTVTGPSTSNALLRVSSLDDLYTDDSNNPFSIYTPVDWLTVQPLSGSLAYAQSELLLFGYDAAGLVPDTYVAYAVISHNGEDSPLVVPVTLTVQNPSSGLGPDADIFRLQGNYPNPFNPATVLRFSLPAAAEATIDVIDLQGRVVRTLFSGRLEAGATEMQWNGRNDAGRLVGSGIYLARLRSGDRMDTHKMMLSK